MEKKVNPRRRQQKLKGEEFDEKRSHILKAALRGAPEAVENSHEKRFAQEDGPCGGKTRFSALRCVSPPLKLRGISMRKGSSFWMSLLRGFDLALLRLAFRDSAVDFGILGGVAF